MHLLYLFSTPVGNSLRLATLLTGLAAAQVIQNGTNGTSTVPTPAQKAGVIRTGPGIGHNLYRIGPGDVLDSHVFGRPNLAAEAVRVDEQGMIALPMIGSIIKAGCLTQAELSNVIADQYKEYLVDPQVTVGIRQYSSQVVSVNGAVQRPGTFELQRRVRLRELIAVAGGLSPAAGEAILIAHDSSRAVCDTTAAAGEAMRTIGIRSMRVGLDSENPYIEPGDYISVQEAGLAYVVGNVNRPSPVALAEPVTLTRALAMAGGKLPGSRDDIRILRHAPEAQNRMVVLPFSMKAILNNKQEDPVLRTGDIVEVNISFTKATAKLVLASIASTVPVYYPLVFLR